jgi:hypothetical protein
MAPKTTPSQACAPEAEKHFGPHHQAFSWLCSTEFDPRAELVERTYDVCKGVATCLDIVMNEQLRTQSHGGDDTDENDRSLIGASATESLLRLALAATKMLAADADAAIAKINQVSHREEK